MIVSRLESVRNPDRLNALRASGLLDTPTEEAFDRLVRLTSKVLRVPTVLFSLVDAERQFLKSCHGLPEPWLSRRELPLSHSFCWIVVATGEPLLLSDARQHPIASGSPAIRELGAIAYAGMPLRVASGHLLGTLAVVDRQPRSWGDDEAQTLKDLADLVVGEIERRETARQIDQLRAQVAESDVRASLVASIGEGLCGLDRDGNCTYLNRAGAAMLGYEPAEILGRSFHALVHHSHADGSPYGEDECPIRRALRTGETCRIENDVLWRRDLTSFRAAYAAFPIVEEGITRGAAVLFSDVTVRRRSEEERENLLSRERAARIEAESAQQRLAFLARASALASTSLDIAAILTGVSSVVVPFLADWCAVDVVQEDGALRRVAAAHVNAAMVALVRELPKHLLSESRSLSGIDRLLTTGQAEIVAEVGDHDLVTAARDAKGLTLLRAVGLRSLMRVPLVLSGKTLGAITFALAESGRRYRQADLILAEDLARRVAQALANARLHQEILDAVRVRNELLISVSHDLRNPLANLKGFAQLVLRDVRQMRTPEAEEMATWLTRIDATVVKMTALLDELLDLARSQAGQPLDLEYGPTDLVALARQIADVYQQTDERHSIRVETTLEGLTGRWDARRLERVLSNLLSNAIKYSPGGGDIVITLARENVAGRAWGVMTVRDHGVGIPASDLPHVFEPFYRGTNVASRSGGVGVGLASVRQIVEQHGGSIGVTSEEGKGTVFTVRLPVTSPES
jgi:PAS domain S-box-containing protein